MSMRGDVTGAGEGGQCTIFFSMAPGSGAWGAVGGLMLSPTSGRGRRAPPAQ